MNGIKGNKTFKSERLAMEFAFDLIENGDAQNFAKRHPLPKIHA